MKIALIAHDGKKADMVAFVMKRLDFFNNKKVEVGDSNCFIYCFGAQKM